MRGAALLTFLALAACASSGDRGDGGEGNADSGIPSDPYARQDPLEPVNRFVFSINKGIDFWLLRPAATVYHDVLPVGVQHAVNNVLVNLNQPIVFANSILQGDIDNAGKAMGKFAANSFMGMAGLMDVTPDIQVRDADFGETLAVWGVGDTAYLVLPLIGPSTVRDGLGYAVDALADPFNRIALNRDMIAFPIARGVATAVNARSQALGVLDELEATSVDFYASMRSLYLQRRAADIRAAKGESGAAQTSLPKFE
ncbi:MAG: VacJ family lipoprotein [Sneathiellaceae bacterium]